MLYAALVILTMTSAPYQAQALDGSLGAKSVGVAKITLYVAPQALVEVRALTPKTLLKHDGPDQTICFNYNAPSGGDTRVLVASSAPGATHTYSFALLYQGDLTKPQCDKQWFKAALSKGFLMNPAKKSLLRLVFEPVL